MPSSHLILCRPLLLLPLIFPSMSLFQWVNSSQEVAKVLEFQLQHRSFQRTPRTDLLQNGLVGSPCSPWDSQESSPTPQFKSINSSVLSFLHSPTLTSIHDYCLGLNKRNKGSHDLSASSWWVGCRNPSLLAKSQVNLCWLYSLVQRKATASFATEPRSQGVEAMAHDGSLKSREAKKQKPALWMPHSFVLFSFSSPFPTPRRPWMLSLKEHNNTS